MAIPSEDRSWLAALLLSAAALLGGCASAPQRVAEAPPARIIDIGSLAAANASRLVGSPYRFGGATPAGFDCSGLVYYSFLQAGVSVPRSTELQHRAASPVPLGEARSGDLLFFHLEGKVSHVGIYLGDGRFVHAPTSGKAVQFASLDLDYYRRHLAGVGRVAAAAP
jgi:murein DD-endopeptidase